VVTHGNHWKRLMNITRSLHILNMKEDAYLQVTLDYRFWL
jgi:hypothetical protein